jgi:hypothetical protein
MRTCIECLRDFFLREKDSREDESGCPLKRLCLSKCVRLSQQLLSSPTVQGPLVASL